MVPANWYWGVENNCDSWTTGNLLALAYSKGGGGIVHSVSCSSNISTPTPSTYGAHIWCQTPWESLIKSAASWHPLRGWKKKKREWMCACDLSLLGHIHLRWANSLGKASHDLKKGWAPTKPVKLHDASQSLGLSCSSILAQQKQHGMHKSYMQNSQHTTGQHTSSRPNMTHLKRAPQRTHQKQDGERKKGLTKLVSAPICSREDYTMHPGEGNHHHTSWSLSVAYNDLQPKAN